MWMPSTPGTPAVDGRVAPRRSRGAITVEVVADERRQEAGRAEAAVRARRSRGCASTLGIVVEQHAAAAVDLAVDEARHSRRPRRSRRCGLRAARIVRWHERRDALALDEQDTWSDDEAVAVQDARH